MRRNSPEAKRLLARLCGVAEDVTLACADWQNKDSRLPEVFDAATQLLEELLTVGPFSAMLVAEAAAGYGGNEKEPTAGPRETLHAAAERLRLLAHRAESLTDALDAGGPAAVAAVAELRRWAERERRALAAYRRGGAA